jgi:hypothetical protein
MSTPDVEVLKRKLSDALAVRRLGWRRLDADAVSAASFEGGTAR